jgi:cytochrome c oxidase subunit 2
MACTACATPRPAAARIHCGTTYGKQLYETTCIACHSIDGTPRVGPTFQGLWGKQETVVEAATGTVKTVTIDRSYLKESLHDPNTWKVVGFEAQAMTSFTNFGEDEIDAMITFLATLK